MRLTNTAQHTAHDQLFGQRPPSPPLCPLDSFSRAEKLRVEVLLLTDIFGPLTTAELSQGLGYPPDSTTWSVYRTARQLAEAGLVFTDRNFQSGLTFELSDKGASVLAKKGLRGTQSRGGYRRAGPSSLHTSKSTAFLLQAALRGWEVAGSHAMRVHRLPYQLSEMLKAKPHAVPDGLIWRCNADGDVGTVYTLEQTTFAASSSAIHRKVLTHLARSEDALVAGSIFNTDEKRNCAPFILKAADELWGRLPAAERAELENKVILSVASFDRNWVARSYEMTTLHEHRKLA